MIKLCVLQLLVRLPSLIHGSHLLCQVVPAVQPEMVGVTRNYEVNAFGGLHQLLKLARKK